MKHHIASRSFVENNAVTSFAINDDTALVTDSTTMLQSGSSRSTMIQDDYDGEPRDKVSLQMYNVGNDVPTLISSR